MMIRSLIPIARLETMTLRHISYNKRVIPKAFLIIESKSLIHTSTFLCKKGGGGSKKSKKNNSKDYIDKALDELSDDEDEHNTNQMQPDLALLNPNSPVNKFIKSRAKGKNLTHFNYDYYFFKKCPYFGFLPHLLIVCIARICHLAIIVLFM